MAVFADVHCDIFSPLLGSQFLVMNFSCTIIIILCEHNISVKQGGGGVDGEDHVGMHEHKLKFYYM